MILIRLEGLCYFQDGNGRLIDIIILPSDVREEEALCYYKLPLYGMFESHLFSALRLPAACLLLEELMLI